MSCVVTAATRPPPGVGRLNYRANKKTAMRMLTTLIAWRIYGSGWNRAHRAIYNWRQLTPVSRVLLEKLIVPQLPKKYPAFYGTRRFFTVFTKNRHLSLSWARPNQSMSPHPTPCTSILILSSHLRLGLPSGLFPSGLPTKTLYAPLLSPHTCHMPRPSHSSWFEHPNILQGVPSMKLLVM